MQGERRPSVRGAAVLSRSAWPPGGGGWLSSRSPCYSSSRRRPDRPPGGSSMRAVPTFALAAWLGACPWRAIAADAVAEPAGAGGAGGGGGGAEALGAFAPGGQSDVV